MPSSIDTIKLKNEITELRKTMIHTGQKNGLTHPETIKYSQELDRLIYKYQLVC
jgi:hypothetical protein